VRRTICHVRYPAAYATPISRNSQHQISPTAHESCIYRDHYGRNEKGLVLKYGNHLAELVESERWNRGTAGELVGASTPTFSRRAVAAVLLGRLRPRKGS
jgi:hypothetical protein